MRMELIKLLHSNEIVHPTTIKAANFHQGRLSISVSGYPWWKPPGARAVDGSIELIFNGLSEGTLDACISNLDFSGNEHDEALEDFGVEPLSSFAWAPPDVHSIYCSSALREPASLYESLDNYLVTNDSYRRPLDFLNSCATLSQFRELCASNSFLLARCPDAIRELLCVHLVREGVAFNVISTSATPENRLRVKLGNSDFLCDEAIAEFD
jgi:hypothetical protein